MSNAPESAWTTVARERVPLCRRYTTTELYFTRVPDGGEELVELQRDRLLPWRGRTRTVRFEDRVVTG